jgi:hypothetical protein
MNDPKSSAEQLRDEMRQLRSHMDADVESFVENTRGLLDWHSYYQSSPWLFLGAAALTGYLLVPTKARHVTVSIDDLAALAKQRQVVVRDHPGPAKGSAGSNLTQVVTGLLWKAALAVATQQLNQFLSSRPPSGPGPGLGRPPSETPGQGGRGK